MADQPLPAAPVPKLSLSSQPQVFEKGADLGQESQLGGYVPGESAVVSPLLPQSRVLSASLTLYRHT